MWLHPPAFAAAALRCFRAQASPLHSAIVCLFIPLLSQDMHCAPPFAQGIKLPPGVLQSLDATKVAETFAKAKKMGIDPVRGASRGLHDVWCTAQIGQAEMNGAKH